MGKTAPVLTLEDRASMFIEWCALKGFGCEGWPEGAHKALLGHFREAVAEEREDWRKWLAETHARIAAREFDIETAIACGWLGHGVQCGDEKLTPHDAGQVGYAGAVFQWSAAIRERGE